MIMKVKKIIFVVILLFLAGATYYTARKLKVPDYSVKKNLTIQTQEGQWLVVPKRICNSQGDSISIKRIIEYARNDRQIVARIIDVSEESYYVTNSDSLNSTSSSIYLQRIVLSNKLDVDHYQWTNYDKSQRVANYLSILIWSWLIVFCVLAIMFFNYLTVPKKH